ncbi:putative polysaccharide biosynthesis protein epsC [Fibrisoma limi BUZ 3]|uniref:Putative polysaccharide biosynthesis protein epsC n=1 Tax=Fibrisoma limi BUZ 3 TaxID=1185876 RepID=I2GTC9_9BACT|nr:nucleoside-diphosphate sugar epimerase/dehydratase [Fibrisoma limi]CCH57158.1 putative polysaccharide biosynthesis protein epsC [Fibrisoma limi BUZ 3]
MIHLLSTRFANRFAPRLLVLSVDLAVTLFAFVCAWMLRFNFTVDPANWHNFHLVALLVSRFLLFILIRPFQGIIRHTGVEDAQLITQAVTFSSLLAGFGSYALSRFLAESWLYIPASILAIEYFISMVLLIGIRFGIKYLYYKLLDSPRGDYQDVLIYGAGDLGTRTKDMLQRDRRQRYRILGFIDDNPTKTGKTVRGVKVYSPLEVAAVFLHAPRKPQVILAIATLQGQRRHEISGFLQQYQLSSTIVPSAQDWMNGKSSQRKGPEISVEDLLGRPTIRLDSTAVDDLLRNQTILVTGAAGSIGSELVRQLLNHEPARIILVDQAESALYDLIFRLRRLPNHIGADAILTPQVADVTDADRMQQLFQQYLPQFVFHAAAYKHVPLMEEHPYEAVKVNVLGTKIVANLALAFKVKKFVLVSTDKAVNPTNVMGATKRLAEMYLQSLNDLSQASFTGSSTRFITTRFGNVLGSSGSVVPIFKQQIEAGGPVTVTHPDIIRYFMTIPEACQLVLEAAAMGQGNEVFVFDMGQPVRIADLARQMIHLSGYRVNQDIALEFTGLRPGEKLYEELLNSTESTLPTHHPKILIARLQTPDAYQLQQAISQLEQALQYVDNTLLVSILKEAIPEYVSHNSPYVALDRNAQRSLSK